MTSSIEQLRQWEPMTLRDSKLGNDSTLRVIRSFNGIPEHDLAIEGWLVREDASEDPILFLYGWNHPVMVLGFGQDPRSIDQDACATLGVPVLRRISGGTGVLHGSDLAVSLILPVDHPWTRSIGGLYERFLAAILLAMQPLGVSLDRPAQSRHHGKTRSPICFEDNWGETLLAGGRKAIGCAQAWRKNRVLVHCTMLRGVDAALHASAFGVDASRILAAIGPVSDPPPSRKDLAQALVTAVSEALRLNPVLVASTPTSDECEGTA